MGFSRGNYSTSIPTHPNHISLSTKTSTLDQCSEDENDDIKIKSLFYKMIWDLGLSCFIQKTHQRSLSAGKDQVEKEKVVIGSNLEHNKAWLLAESGGSGTDLNSTEPHSVHSSFRFSFCSQVELETIKANSSSSATVLMVNLHNGMLDSSKAGGGDFSLKRIESLEKSISPVSPSLVRFSYAEIASATRNFTKGRVLGRGALSCVFRGRVGILRNAVAIKRLDKEDKESSKAFCRELMIASSLHNPHIVPLVGFCIHPEEGLFLVYKFVSGGSLERYLHEKKRGVKGGRPALPWSVRYKVAVGIAEAIAYLHNGTERCIVHRDIKPSNILLSSRKSAKLCDFGLAAWTPAPSVPFLCKTVKGTFGYLAPEYFQHGKVSDKTDVYAFGIVLLELLTGRKPIKASRGPGEENLVLWFEPSPHTQLWRRGRIISECSTLDAHPWFFIFGCDPATSPKLGAKALLHQGCNDKLLDPCLKFTEKHSGRVSRMVQTAHECIHNEESRRPNMQEVIALLRGAELNCINKTRNGLVLNRCISERYTQLQLTKSDMKSHLALAMVGVSESEGDDQLYCR